MRLFLNRGEDPETYYRQENNPTEQILRKQGAENWLVSCGPTAAVSIVHATGREVDCLTPGGWKPQPEEILTGYFNDPSNSEKLKSIRNLDPQNWLGNTVPQWYEAAIYDVFGISARFYWGLVFHDLEICIHKNIGILACLKNPGHYVAIVGFDSDKKTVIYNDPWEGNFWPESLKGRPGFNRELPWNEFSNNLNLWRVEIG